MRPHRDIEETRLHRPLFGGEHEIKRRGIDRAITLNPHQGDISIPTLARILRELGITRDEWERL